MILLTLVQNKLENNSSIWRIRRGGDLFEFNQLSYSYPDHIFSFIKDTNWYAALFGLNIPELNIDLIKVQFSFVNYDIPNRGFSKYIER